MMEHPIMLDETMERLEAPEGPPDMNTRVELYSLCVQKRTGLEQDILRSATYRQEAKGLPMSVLALGCWVWFAQFPVQ